MSNEYTPLDVYKFASDGDVDHLRIALNSDSNCSDWYKTPDDYEDENEDHDGEVLIGANALIVASSHDNIECISILLDHGIDIESVNFHGDTALTVAAY